MAVPEEGLEIQIRKALALLGKEMTAGTADLEVETIPAAVAAVAVQLVEQVRPRSGVVGGAVRRQQLQALLLRVQVVVEAGHITAGPAGPAEPAVAEMALLVAETAVLAPKQIQDRVVVAPVRPRASLGWEGLRAMV